MFAFTKSDQVSAQTDSLNDSVVYRPRMSRRTGVGIEAGAACLVGAASVGLALLVPDYNFCAAPTTSSVPERPNLTPPPVEVLRASRGRRG